MKYLLLVYGEEEPMRQIRDAECMRYGETLQERGCRLGGSALEPVRTATTVRKRDGQVLVTDGPFAETKEQLAGFYLVDAKDLDEAVEIAAGIPPARIGSIEIRPVRELEP
jgi:hypothetical protein